MTDLPQYDPGTLDLVKQLEAEQTDINQIVSQSGLSLQDVMAVRKHAAAYGWDAIRGDDSFLNDDDFENEPATAAEPMPVAGNAVLEAFAAAQSGAPVDDKPVYDEIEPVISQEAVDAKAAVEATVAAPRRRKIEAEFDARGKKPSNTQKKKEFNFANRRRKRGGPENMVKRLQADETKFDPDYHYRWILDKPGRVRQLTQHDDYEIVDDAHAHAGVGGNVQVPAGNNHYNADNQILVRKPKVFHEADQAEKQERLRAFERQVESGKAGADLNDEGKGDAAILKSLKDGADGSRTYNPSDMAQGRQKNRIGQADAL